MAGTLPADPPCRVICVCPVTCSVVIFPDVFWPFVYSFEEMPIFKHFLFGCFFKYSGY